MVGKRAAGPSRGPGGHGPAHKGKGRGKGVARAREMPRIPRVSDARLQRVSLIASRSGDEGCGMDELDALQFELEQLLCAAALRARACRAELDAMADRDAAEATSRRRPGAHPRAKAETRLVRAPSSTTPEPADEADAPPRPAVADANADSERPPPKKLASAAGAAPKNNAPYKFWTSIEPYCGPITNDDLRGVEALLRASAEAPSPPIPPLGRHYADAWADERVAREQTRSHPNKAKTKESLAEAAALRKKAERTLLDGGDSTASPLARRLASSLLDERPLAPPSKRSAVSYRNCITLERSLRRELVELGALDPEDLAPAPDPADDEILVDIKKCASELEALRKTNARHLRRLAALCRREIARNDLKKRLRRVDDEIVEIYKKRALARQKKQPLTKKEREEAWGAIEEQIRLNEEIDALPPTGPYS